MAPTDPHIEANVDSLCDDYATALAELDSLPDGDPRRVTVSDRLAEIGRKLASFDVFEEDPLAPGVDPFVVPEEELTRRRSDAA